MDQSQIYNVHQVKRLSVWSGETLTSREQEQLTFTDQALCLTSCFLNQSQLSATSAFNFSIKKKNKKTWKFKALNMSRSFWMQQAEPACSSVLKSMVPVIIEGGNELLFL